MIAKRAKKSTDSQGWKNAQVPSGWPSSPGEVPPPQEALPPEGECTYSVKPPTSPPPPSPPLPLPVNDSFDPGPVPVDHDMWGPRLVTSRVKMKKKVKKSAVFEAAQPPPPPPPTEFTF
jgi:hypothetical protein